MSAPSAAFVLAAGFGTRMRPLTDATPKPLLPVAGRALIDHALDRCAEAGVSRAVVNLHYLGDAIRAHLASRTRPAIAFSEERPDILETGGGAVAALPLLGPAPFYTVNSDAIWTGPAPLPALAACWAPERMDALLLLVARESAVAYSRPGDFDLDLQGRPLRRGDAAQAPFVYTGAQIVAPAAFESAPAGAFSMNLIWDRLLARGRLFAIVHRGGWVDVGTPDGLEAAGAALAGAA